jgi:integral membrane protein
MLKQLLNTNLGKFRLIALLEGISYLFLLCVAMPLKYKFGFESIVKYTGWIHGVLFITYGILLLIVWKQYKWSFKKVVLAFISSLLPFGTFIFDKQLRTKN